jgi:hypothetical protein
MAFGVASAGEKALEWGFVVSQVSKVENGETQIHG